MLALAATFSQCPLFRFCVIHPRVFAMVVPLVWKETVCARQSAASEDLGLLVVRCTYYGDGEQTMATSRWTIAQEFCENLSGSLMLLNRLKYDQHDTAVSHRFAFFTAPTAFLVYLRSNGVSAYSDSLLRSDGTFESRAVPMHVSRTLRLLGYHSASIQQLMRLCYTISSSWQEATTTSHASHM